MSYKKDFRKTRLVILLALIPALAGLAAGWLTDDVRWGWVFVGGALLFALLHVLLWRCPECRGYLGRGLGLPADGRCPLCGKAIAPPEREALPEEKKED